MGGDKIVAFAAFLTADDPLYKYSDDAFHATCFALDPNNDELEQAWAEHRRLWDERPVNAKTWEERNAWGRKMMAEFKVFRRKQRGLD